MKSVYTEPRIKPLFWDYDITEGTLNEILRGELQEAKGITRSKIYSRLLESYSWYQILKIIDSNQIAAILSDDIIEKIWNKPLQKRYQYAKGF